MAAGAGSYSSPVDFRIPQQPPDFLSPELRVALAEPYAAFQNIIQALVNNCGIGPQPLGLQPQLASQAIASTILSGNLRRLYVLASENILGGAMISLHAVAGVANVRNANATTNARICDGFCSQPGGIAIGTVGEVMLSTGIATIGGLTVGQRYWLNTVNGQVINVAPVAAGNVEQYIGIALTTTQLYVNTQAWIQH